MASETLERTLYNGKYHVVHNPNARGRTPRYLVNATVKPQGVTTIIGQTLAKDLMQWAVDACVSFLRLKLPIVSEEDLLESSTAHIKLRDAGGDTGSVTHKLVEQFLKGSEPVLDDIAPEAINAYLAFVDWFVEVKPEILGVEEVVYSPSLEYAGCYDCLLKIDDKVYLCDLKTTNTSRNAPKGIYSENFIQLGAYALAHDEQMKYEIREAGTSELPEIDDLMVISAKKNGRLDVQKASDVGLKVKDCMAVFKQVVALHNFMQSVTKKLKEV